MNAHGTTIVYSRNPRLFFTVQRHLFVLDPGSLFRAFIPVHPLDSVGVY